MIYSGQWKWVEVIQVTSKREPEGPVSALPLHVSLPRPHIFQIQLHHPEPRSEGGTGGNGPESPCPYSTSGK